MSHFYSVDYPRPVLLPDVTTPAQARRHPDVVYPSVTTVLGVLKDPFLDEVWRPQHTARLARENPDLSWQDVQSLLFGMVTHPTNGTPIKSSEFGTGVHQCIEYCLENGDRTVPDHLEPYLPWAQPWLIHVKRNGIDTIATERIVWSDVYQIAGSVDYIGIEDGQYFLADYKCRSNCKGKAKVYAKDCQQLAIEAIMLRDELGLDYVPRCITVCIDIDTLVHYHHEWTLPEIRSAADIASLCATLYHATRM